MKICKLVLHNGQINPLDYKRFVSRIFFVHLAERDQTLNIKRAINIQYDRENHSQLYGASIRTVLCSYQSQTASHISSHWQVTRSWPTVMVTYENGPDSVQPAYWYCQRVFKVDCGQSP